MTDRIFSEKLEKVAGAFADWAFPKIKGRDRFLKTSAVVLSAAALAACEGGFKQGEREIQSGDVIKLKSSGSDVQVKFNFKQMEDKVVELNSIGDTSDPTAAKYSALPKVQTANGEIAFYNFNPGDLMQAHVGTMIEPVLYRVELKPGAKIFPTAVGSAASGIESDCPPEGKFWAIKVITLAENFIGEPQPAGSIMTSPKNPNLKYASGFALFTGGGIEGDANDLTISLTGVGYDGDPRTVEVIR